MSTSNFDYGPVAIGTFQAMLWFTLVVLVINPLLLIFYVPLLLFLGLGLKPFLIKTGLAAKYQAYSAQRMDRLNKKLKNGYHARNSKKLAQRDKYLKNMREKMKPKL